MHVIMKSSTSQTLGHGHYRSALPNGGVFGLYIEVLSPTEQY